MALMCCHASVGPIADRSAASRHTQFLHSVTCGVLYTTAVDSSASHEFSEHMLVAVYVVAVHQTCRCRVDSKKCAHAFMATARAKPSMRAATVEDKPYHMHAKFS